MTLQDFRHQYRLCRALLRESLGNLARCPDCESIYPLVVVATCPQSGESFEVENTCPCNERMMV